MPSIRAISLDTRQARDFPLEQVDHVWVSLLVYTIYQSTASQGSPVLFWIFHTHLQKQPLTINECLIEDCLVVFPATWLTLFCCLLSTSNWAAKCSTTFSSLCLLTAAQWDVLCAVGLGICSSTEPKPDGSTEEMKTVSQNTAESVSHHTPTHLIHC